MHMITKVQVQGGKEISLHEVQGDLDKAFPSQHKVKQDLGNYLLISKTLDVENQNGPGFEAHEDSNKGVSRMTKTKTRYPNSVIVSPVIFQPLHELVIPKQVRKDITTYSLTKSNISSTIFVNYINYLKNWLIVRN